MIFVFLNYRLAIFVFFTQRSDTLTYDNKCIGLPHHICELIIVKQASVIAGLCFEIVYLWI